MSTHDSTTRTAPTRGSTAGAGAAESIKETVHNIQGISDTVRENAMDFVETMFGTPRHPESSAGAARSGEGATHAERAPGDATRHPGPDDAAAHSSTSAASHTDDAAVRSSEPTRDPTAGGGTTGTGGGTTEAAPTQPMSEKATAPPPLPPRDV